MKTILRSFLALGITTLALLVLIPHTYAADYEVSCTGTSGSETAITEATYGSSDNLTLSDGGGDGYCILDAALSVNDLTIETGVILTHAAADKTGVNVTAAGNVVVTGDINVDERGCAGGPITGDLDGFSPDGSGDCTEGATGAGLATGAYPGQAAGGGGGHGGSGGRGSNASLAAGGAPFDSSLIPAFLGSGGGAGINGSGADQVGGAGGGFISLNVTGTLTVSGSISANGENGKDGTSSSGGGSGGGIYVSTGTLAGAGSISAAGGNGGNGTSKDGGGAGGGRIAVLYDTLSGFTLANITAAKGSKGSGGSGGSLDGEKGTTFIVDNTTDAVRVTSGLDFIDGGDYSRASFTIDSGAILYCGSGIGTLTISATGNYTDNGSTWNCTESITTKVDMDVTGTLTTTGITWDFAAVPLVELTAATWTMASGTNALTIDLTGAEFDTSITNNVTFTNFTYTGGVPGTSSSTGGVWDWDNNAIDLALVNSDINSSLDWQSFTTVNIDSDSSLSADAKGCAGGPITGDLDGFAPTAGVCTEGATGAGMGEGAYPGTAAGGGGGHGGAGGSSTGAGGSTYDSNTLPVLYGAGGGAGINGSGSDNVGGVGAGKIYLDVTGTLTVDGSISANGGDGNAAATASGGGSGGAVYISVGTLAGSGSINANGGNGGDGSQRDAGGGGGGRVAIIYGTATFDVGSMTAANTAVKGPKGGTDGGPSDGSDGTLYTLQQVILDSIAITDTSGYTTDTTPEITLTESGATPTHVAFSCDNSNWSSWLAIDDNVANDGDGPAFDFTTDATNCSATEEEKTIYAKIKDDGVSTSSVVSDTTTYDVTGPTVSTVSSALANDTYTTDQVLTVTVQFDENVDVVTTGGTPYITLDMDDTDRNAPYTSGTGTDTLTFSYTIVSGDNKADLDYTATDALALNSGTIKDPAGNAATLTLATPGEANSLGANKDIVVSTNQAPTITALSVTASSTTDGSGEVNISFEIDDPDDDDTLEAKVEYSLNNGGAWATATLYGDAENVTATYGTPVINGGELYNVGTAAGYITSSSGANTITVIWNSQFDQAAADTDQALVRITPYDGIVAGTAVQTASNFTMDNVVPAALANFSVGSMTATTAPLTWTAATDTNFDHYEIWYSTTQSNAQNRTGDAVEWDDSDDANLTTATTASTTITGLTEDLVYYVKIWAIDSYGNITTLSDTTADTNTAPISLASFTSTDTTSSSITYTWTAASDPNFDHYEIWYGTVQNDVENRTGTATEWDGDDDSNLNTATTATTTITGLSEDTTYYAKIWAIDANTNESTLSTATANNNGRPTLASLTATQSSAGDGKVTISYIMDDSDDDNTLQGKIEYTLNGSTWSKATILETAEDVTATYGTPNVENDNTYQVGNVSGYVTSSSGANTITVIWDSATDEASASTSTAQVRVTPYDGTEAGAVLTSSANILVDNVAPVGMDDLAKGSATATQMVLTWTAAATETSFDHYEVWYGTTQADVEARSGTATEWDTDDDATLGTLATATTTITGLTEGTTYYFRIHAIDSTGNDTNAATLTAATNNIPTVTSVTPVAATDGTGNVTVVIITNDADTEGVELLVEYSLDGSTWAEATIDEETFSVLNGTLPTVENDNTRQIGESGSRISTTGGANTMTVLWPSVTDAPTADASTIQLRATSYDGIESGTATASDAFTLDNLAPAWTSSLTMQTEDGTGLVLSWTVGTDTNFSHYEAWYGTNMTEVLTRGAGASEWDNDDDTDLATATTTGTTIQTTVLDGQTYSVGVWMVDTYGNESGPIDASVRRGPSTIQIDATTGNTLTFGGGGSGEDGYIPDFVDITPDEETVEETIEEEIIVIEEEIVEEIIEDVEEEVEEEIEETEELEDETLEEEVAEEAEELEEWDDDSVEEIEEAEEESVRDVEIVYADATLGEVVDNVDEIIPEDVSWSATSLKDFGTLDIVQTVYNTSTDLNVLIFDFFFAPEETLTRVQLLQLSMHVFVDDLFDDVESFMDFEFADVEDGANYVAYLSEAVARGVISGYDDGTFHPEEAATRAEALKILFRSNGIVFIDDPSKGVLEQFGLEENPFTDVDLEEWYAPYVLYGYTNGYVSGYADGTFRPSQGITRAEYSSMLTTIHQPQ